MLRQLSVRVVRIQEAPHGAAAPAGAGRLPSRFATGACRRLGAETTKEPGPSRGRVPEPEQDSRPQGLRPRTPGPPLREHPKIRSNSPREVAVVATGGAPLGPGTQRAARPEGSTTSTESCSTITDMKQNPFDPISVEKAMVEAGVLPQPADLESRRLGNNEQMFTEYDPRKYALWRISTRIRC